VALSACAASTLRAPQRSPGGRESDIASAVSPRQRSGSERGVRVSAVVTTIGPRCGPEQGFLWARSARTSLGSMGHNVWDRSARTHGLDRRVRMGWIGQSVCAGSARTTEPIGPGPTRMGWISTYIAVWARSARAYGLDRPERMCSIGTYVAVWARSARTHGLDQHVWAESTRM
jgi:hypothetical protein